LDYEKIAIQITGRISHKEIILDTSASERQHLKIRKSKGSCFLPLFSSSVLFAAVVVVFIFSNLFVFGKVGVGD